MLETIGYHPDLAGWPAAADCVLGRVVCVDRGLADVLTDIGPVRVSFGGGLLSEVAVEVTAAPCTGDWVLLREWPDGRVTLERVLPRRTAVVRATAGEQSHGQVLCSNVDVVAVVVALHPVPSVSKVERMLALAWESGARPVVVLTKADLVDDAELVAEDVRAAAPGVEVICASSVSGQGVGRLRELVDGRHTIGLLGTSGHGKSSLVNALVGTEVLGTREIRADGRGRHTSVRRELVALPGGGAVIDTPGLRGVGLLDGEEGLAAAFGDVDELVGACRFGDCSHRTEPGCAVVAALEDGRLTQRRFESWQRLRREVDAMARRKEARLRSRKPRRTRRPGDDGSRRG